MELNRVDISADQNGERLDRRRQNLQTVMAPHKYCELSGRVQHNQSRHRKTMLFFLAILEPPLDRSAPR